VEACFITTNQLLTPKQNLVEQSKTWQSSKMFYKQQNHLNEWVYEHENQEQGCLAQLEE